MSQGDLSAFFGEGFDPTTVKPADDFTVLPTGKYPVLIEGSEVKQTKAGNGHYLELQLVIIDGPGKGRKLWDRLNIDNPNPVAVEMALRTLSAVVKATIGTTKFADTTQLLQKTCIASVKVGKDGENGIRTYLSFADSASVQAPPATAPAQPVMQAPPAQVPIQQPVQQTVTAGPPQQLAQQVSEDQALGRGLRSQQPLPTQQQVVQAPVAQQPMAEQVPMTRPGNVPWNRSQQ
jgi:hypothetical protein